LKRPPPISSQIERVEGQKLAPGKGKTMLDSYCQQSPEKDGNGKKDMVKKNSLFITKLHNKTETIDDITDEENFMVERSKREMNFKPI
jgi:hypothetical protein